MQRGIVGKVDLLLDRQRGSDRNQPDLDSWISSIRSRDPMTFEEAYHGPRPSGPAVIDRLVHELVSATDTYTRGKFIELLGEMGGKSVTSILVAELGHPDEVIREWAVAALKELGVSEGADAVQEYLAHRSND
jgi:hypothetical protein